MLVDVIKVSYNYIGQKNDTEDSTPQKQLSLGDRTPLMEAASEGWKDVLQLLVNRGANKDLVDSDGKTALQYALEENHKECVQMLQIKL